MLLDLERRKLISGFQPGVGSLSITHLQFTDDTLIFLNASLEEVFMLRAVLRLFELVSGLKINFSKSSLIPVGEVVDLAYFASLLDCKAATLPISYLGLPIGAPFRASSIWSPFIEKLEHRLSLWRRKSLSKGGRLVLIRSCLLSLPIYFLSILPIPASISNQLEKLVRDFLWGSSPTKRRIHYVNWETCKLPISSGGLGLKGFRVMNRALLAKWVWRFSKEREALWRVVIKAKFGVERGDTFPKAPRSSHGSSLWKSICHEINFIKEHSEFQIGSGESVRFWWDRWCGPQSLKIAAPSLYRIVQLKHSTVAEVVQLVNGQIDIQLRFYSDVTYDMLQEVVLIHNWVSAHPVVPGSEDVLLWNGTTEDKGFSVSECYKKLMNPLLHHYPCRAVWRKNVPLKFLFFAWSAARNSIATNDRLIRCGKFIVNRCFMCKSTLESCRHLLVHCRFATSVWHAFLSSFGVAWSMPWSVLDVLAQWRCDGLSLRGRLIWLRLPHAILWCLWKERNARCYDGKESSIRTVILAVRGLLHYWFMGMEEFKGFSQEHFVFHFRGIISL